MNTCRQLYRITYAFAIMITILQFTFSLGFADDRLRQFEYSLESEAKVTNGENTLPAYVPPGSVFATNENEAMIKAQAEAKERIASVYKRADGWVLVQGSLKVKVQEKVKAPIEDSESRVRLTLLCQTVLNKKGQPDAWVFDAPIHRKPDVSIDRFNVRILVKDDDEDDEIPYETVIRTMGRGKLHERDWYFSREIWSDPLENGAQKKLTVTVEQKSPNGDKYITIGKFRVRLTCRKDKLSVKWIPIKDAEIEGPMRDGPLHSRQFKLTGARFHYLAIVHVENAAEVKEGFARLKAEREAKDKKMKEALNKAGPSIRVLQGDASATVEIRFGRGQSIRSRSGVGRIFIVSKDAKAAQQFINNTFPGRKDVRLVKSEEEAKEILERQFDEMCKQLKYVVVPETFKITLEPKTGYTIADELQDSGQKRPK